MFSIKLDWRSFNLNLAMVEAWIKANTTSCTGTSADSQLTCWFTDDQDSATVQHVNDYWNGLTEESVETTSYISEAAIGAAMQAAGEDAVTKTWDQLSTAQKKLVMGIVPTREDLGL